MPISQTQKTQPSTTNTPLSGREIAYYTRRTQNLFFDAIIRALTAEIEAGRITRATLAKRIHKSAPQVTRWLSGPSNLTLNTIGLLLCGMGAEIEPRIIFHRDIRESNYAHPLYDKLVSKKRKVDKDTARKTNIGTSDSSQIINVKTAMTFTSTSPMARILDH